MKKFRKIAAVLLCVVMIAASLQCLAFAAPQDSGKLNFLVLGDSIAEGFGVENKEDAAYGKIVADTNATITATSLRSQTIRRILSERSRPLTSSARASHGRMS